MSRHWVISFTLWALRQIDANEPVAEHISDLHEKLIDRTRAAWCFRIAALETAMLSKSYKVPLSTSGSCNGFGDRRGINMAARRLDVRHGIARTHKPAKLPSLNLRASSLGLGTPGAESAGLTAAKRESQNGDELEHLHIQEDLSKDEMYVVFDSLLQQGLPGKKSSNKQFTLSKLVKGERRRKEVEPKRAPPKFPFGFESLKAFFLGDKRQEGSTPTPPPSTSTPPPERSRAYLEGRSPLPPENTRTQHDVSRKEPYTNSDMASRKGEMRATNVRKQIHTANDKPREHISQGEFASPTRQDVSENTIEAKNNGLLHGIKPSKQPAEKHAYAEFDALLKTHVQNPNSKPLKQLRQGKGSSSKKRGAMEKNTYATTSRHLNRDRPSNQMLETNMYVGSDAPLKKHVRTTNDEMRKQAGRAKDAPQAQDVWMGNEIYTLIDGRVKADKFPSQETEKQAYEAFDELLNGGLPTAQNVNGNQFGAQQVEEQTYEVFEDLLRREMHGNLFGSRSPRLGLQGQALQQSDEQAQSPTLPPRSAVPVGSLVAILQPQNHRTEGIVKSVLTLGKTHREGIKVQLTSGATGRVQKVIDQRPTPVEPPTHTRRSAVPVGTRVAVMQKEDEPIGYVTEGTVQDILSWNAIQPYGVKVRLTSGVVGRVRRVIAPKWAKGNFKDAWYPEADLRDPSRVEDEDLPPRSAIELGSQVAVLQKRDKFTGHLTDGTVHGILTKGPNNGRGIKVQLSSGAVGRVHRVIAPPPAGKDTK